MSEYQIEAIASKVREYDTKFGPMKSYKLKLSGEVDPVELSQKDTTPAPVVGDTLTGTIQDGEYGKKFKKEFAQGGGFKPGGSKPFSSDPFTMYLSYAKDISVARVTAGLDKRETSEIIDDVLANAYVLYGARPDAQPKTDAEPSVDQAKETGKKKVADTIFDTDTMPPEFLK